MLVRSLRNADLVLINTNHIKEQIVKDIEKKIAEEASYAGQWIVNTIALLAIAIVIGACAVNLYPN